MAKRMALPMVLLLCTIAFGMEEKEITVNFMRDLQRVVSFFVDDGKFYMALPHDGGTMTFRPAP